MNYDRYIEPFGGAGWVLFHKDPRRDFEVYNDVDGLLVNLYRCVQDKSLLNQLKEELYYALNSRQLFEEMVEKLNDPEKGTPIQRAAWFYQLIRYSYGSNLTSFGARPYSIQKDFKLFDQAHKRLEKVVVENKDFEEIIELYATPTSLTYCDPPYHMTEKYYAKFGKACFTEWDHIRLRNALVTRPGKFLVSYNDDTFVRALYDQPGIFLEEITRLNNMKQKYDPGSQFPELLIANYDMKERSQTNNQLTLFEQEESP